MQTFLEEVVDDILSKHDRLEKLCIIFPNHWSRSFFKKVFSEKINKTSWLPSLYSMNEWVVEQSSYKIIDHIQIILDFYDVYIKQYPDKKGKLKFDQFYYFANILMHDFSELDKCRADITDVYSYMADEDQIRQTFFQLNEDEIKALHRFWSLDQKSELIINPKNFEFLWRQMPDLYRKLNNRIKKKGLLYEGAAYRLVADMADNGDLPHEEFDCFLFVGFFGLNPSEKAILDFYERQSKAKSYWDVDRYYMDKPYHEARKYLSHELKRRSIVKDNISDNSFELQSKDINIIGAPQKVGQIKLLHNILSNLDKGGLKCIMIPDNSWVLPILTSLPLNEYNVRVASGIPINNTKTFKTYDLIFEILLQHHSQTRLLEKQQVYSFLQLLSSFENDSKLTNLIQWVSNHKDANLLSSDIIGFSKTIDSLFSIDSFQSFINVLKDFSVKYHFAYVKTTNDKLAIEVSQQIYIQLNRINDIICNYGKDFGLRDLIRLVRKLLQNVSVSLDPKFDQELVVLGIHDSLAVDFDQLIILGFNEGVWPPDEPTPSYILDSTKKVFELPTYERQDALYSYLFYRLIQRSKKVYLLYNNISSGGKSSEISRFYHQIKLESGVQIKEEVLEYSLKNKMKEGIIIEKDKHIIKQLNNYLDNKSQKYLSASAYSDYISCPLKFCYKRIIGIKEKDEDELSVSNIGIGNIFHYAMEEIYKTRIGKTIDEKYIDIVNKNLDKIIERAFKRQFKLDNNESFRYRNEQLIIKEVIREFIKKVLRFDVNKDELIISDVEKDIILENAFSFNISGVTQMISLKGVLDRVDHLNGEIRLIDYKTGNSELKFKSEDELFSQATGDRKKTVFQALLYQWMYRKSENIKDVQKVGNHIYSIRSMNNISDSTSIEKNNQNISNLELDDWMSSFEDKLRNLTEEIFNSDTPFTQTKETKTCIKCHYNKICQR